MPKSLYEIMNSSEDNLDEFEKACIALSQARYILAEQKISQLLQVIADSKKLYALMEFCLQEFDFGLELNRAKTPSGLVLPESRKKLVAFVFCLLMSFDSKQTDFEKFLHTFYPSSDVNSEFSEFVQAIIVPFATCIVKAFKLDWDDDLQSVQEKPVVVALAAAGTTQSAVIGELDPLAIQNLSEVAREIIGIVARDSAISDKVREELMLVCEGFDQAVNIGVEKAIRTMYVGLKYTIKNSPMVRQLEVQSENLERLIVEYDLD